MLFITKVIKYSITEIFTVLLLTNQITERAKSVYSHNQATLFSSLLNKVFVAVKK